MRTLSFCLVLVALLAGRAEAKHVRYAGPHPIAARHGGGYCYIEAPHMHVYGPDHPALYQQVGDQYVFIGDPTPFGYDGERHTFYGHHPVIVDDVEEPVYCVIDGPHFHAYAAPPGPDFKMKSDVAFYIGAPLPVKPARVRVVNAEVRPFVSFRPVVTVEPPPEFHAEIYVPGPPGIEVVAPAPPSVVVAPPHPRVSVEVTAPGVYVAPPAPPSVTVVAPPPPHVWVGAPPPAHVYVGAPAPGVVVGGRPYRREHDDDDQGERRGWGREHEHDDGEHEHHDNGKHKGWYK